MISTFSEQSAEEGSTGVGTYGRQEPPIGSRISGSSYDVSLGGGDSETTLLRRERLTGITMQILEI